ncbi:hypothetical protein TNCV_2491551 [Trichonephila clavipes]|nr:hypothetical protein TNCV_2491551 [Trichonephila clavipes]
MKPLVCIQPNKRALEFWFVVVNSWLVFFVGQGLNDDQWHTLHVTRRGQSMDVKVDSEATSRGHYQFLVFALREPGNARKMPQIRSNSWDAQLAVPNNSKICSIGDKSGNRAGQGRVLTVRRQSCNTLVV